MHLRADAHAALSRGVQTPRRHRQAGVHVGRGDRAQRTGVGHASGAILSRVSPSASPARSFLLSGQAQRGGTGWVGREANAVGAKRGTTMADFFPITLFGSMRFDGTQKVCLAVLAPRSPGRLGPKPCLGAHAHVRIYRGCFAPGLTPSLAARLGPRPGPGGQHRPRRVRADGEQRRVCRVWDLQLRCRHG